jgi:hypothetical protein
VFLNMINKYSDQLLKMYLHVYPKNEVWEVHCILESPCLSIDTICPEFISNTPLDRFYSNFRHILHNYIYMYVNAVAHLLFSLKYVNSYGSYCTDIFFLVWGAICLPFISNTTVQILFKLYASLV